MDLCILLFMVPLLTIAFAGIFEMCDEMFGSKPALPFEGMGLPTAKVQLGVLQPMLERSLREALDQGAAIPITLRAAIEDSTAPQLIVVGAFSVLGPLTEVAGSATALAAAASPAIPLPRAVPPISQAFLVPASWESGVNDPTGNA